MFCSIMTIAKGVAGMFFPISTARARAASAGAIALLALVPGIVSACPAPPAAAAGFSAAGVSKTAVASLHGETHPRLSGLTRLLGVSTGRFHAAVRPHDTQPVTSAQSLAIAQGDLPAGVTMSENSQMDAASLDANTGPLVTAFHTATGTYVGSGFGGAWYQAGQAPLDSAGDNAVVEWLGSFYGTADQATARVNDAVAFFKSKNITSTPCSQTSTGCYVFVFEVTISNTPTTLAYATFSNGNVVGELLVATPSSVANANQNNFVALLGAILTGGMKTATNALGGITPTPTTTPTITIKDLELDHKVSGKYKITKTLKSKEKGLFLVVATISNLGTNTAAATVTVSSGGKAIGTGDMTNAGNTQAGDVVFGFLHGFKVKKTTSYKAKVSVSAGTATAQKTISFKVKKA